MRVYEATAAVVTPLREPAIAASFEGFGILSGKEQAGPENPALHSQAAESLPGAMMQAPRSEPPHTKPEAGSRMHVMGHAAAEMT